jgi:Flp pilus assembly protein TadD
MAAALSRFISDPHCGVNSRIRHGQAGDTRIADAKFNLAELFISQNRFVEAVSLLKEAVTIRTSSYHPIADDDAFTYERHAFVLKRLGRTAEADTAASRARSMRLELQYTFRP